MPQIAENVKSVRLTALAQLCELLIADGLTTTKQLVERTGYGERAIRAARAELECRNSSAERNSSAGNRMPERNSSAAPQKEIPPTPPKEKTTYLETTVEKPNNPKPRDELLRDAGVSSLKELSDLMLDAGKGCLHPNAGDLQVMSTPIGWLQDGADFEIDILPTLRAFAKNKPGAMIRKWDYFNNMIAAAKAARTRKLPDVSADNVVPMQSRYPTSNSRIRARMLAEHAALEAQA